MKTTIYELLGMIKDGKAPKKIMYDNKLWEYDVQDKDYWTNHYDGTEWLFDEYVIPDILNEPVEILETTITYKPDKIEKMIVPEPKRWLNYATLEDIRLEIRGIEMKINEIIDRLNNL